MATPAIPSLSWTCQQCGQQVPAGQSSCQNCAAGAGASPSSASRQSRSRLTPAGGLTQKKRIIFIGVAGVIVVLCLISLLVWDGGSPSRKPPAPPPKLQPQAQQQQQQLAAPSPPATEPAKPSPMPPAPASTEPAARAPVAPAVASSQELVRELRRINSRLGEINRRIPAEQAGEAVKALAEITYLLEQERQAASTSAAAPHAQPRRERLSDRELERQYKERLLSQEP